MKSLHFITAILAWLVPILTGLSRAAELKIGDSAPNWQATSSDDKQITADDFKAAEIVVVCLIATDCLFSRSYAERMNELAVQYKSKDVQLVAISVCERDDQETLRHYGEEFSISFPLGHDPTGKTAAEFGARVTPQFFVVQNGRLRYRGSLDDRLRAPSKHHLKNAIDDLLSGRLPSVAETKPFGRGITHPARSAPREPQF